MAPSLESWTLIIQLYSPGGPPVEPTDDVERDRRTSFPIMDDCILAKQ